MNNQKFNIYTKPINKCFVVSLDKAEEFLNIKTNEKVMENVKIKTRKLEKMLKKQ